MTMVLGVGPMPRGYPCWMTWYCNLRESLVSESLHEVTRTINEAFRSEVGTSETVETMQKPGFWRSGQPDGHPDWGAAWKSGIEIVFQPDTDSVVRRVTFRVM